MKTTYQNANAMPTWKLAEILSTYHCVGVDGADYWPIKHELEVELWERQNAETERLIAAFEKQQKEQFKAQSSAHRRCKT